MVSYKPDPELAGPLYGKNPWPLRFHTHSFNAARFNTLASSILYNGHEFGTRKWGYDGKPYDFPSGPPHDEGWQKNWSGRHIITLVDGNTFPGPAVIEWTALDGEKLASSISFDEIFHDRLVLHNVSRDEVKESWLEAKSIHPVSPSILLELNDRTVNVFMRAYVATELDRVEGNNPSGFRDELILAWTHTY